MSGNGISNIDIEKFFSNEENDDLKKNIYGSILIKQRYKIYKFSRCYQ